ncbi:MAG: hypothetical protein ACXAEX_19025 [Promethearchaeota archaeon]|jgi:hypothetical protein
MLELKETLIEGGIKENEMLIIRFRQSRKRNRKIIKNNQKLRELNHMGLYNPRFIQDFESIKRTKGYMSAVYNLPFEFG